MKTPCTAPDLKGSAGYYFLNTNMQHTQKNIFIITGVTLLTATLLASFFLFTSQAMFFDSWGLYIIPFVSSISFLYLTKRKKPDVKAWKLLMLLAILALAYVLLLHMTERIYYADATIDLPSGEKITRYSLNALFTFSTPPAGLFIIITWMFFLFPGLIFALGTALSYVFKNTLEKPTTRKTDSR